jgi:hypothetical protein
MECHYFYPVMVLLFSGDRFSIIDKLFSIHFLTHFFLDRYLKTQAWLISVCPCCWLVAFTLVWSDRSWPSEKGCERIPVMQIDPQCLADLNEC